MLRSCKNNLKISIFSVHFLTWRWCWMEARLGHHYSRRDLEYSDRKRENFSTKTQGKSFSQSTLRLSKHICPFSCIENHKTAPSSLWLGLWTSEAALSRDSTSNNRLLRTWGKRIRPDSSWRRLECWRTLKSSRPALCISWCRSTSSTACRRTEVDHIFVLLNSMGFFVLNSWTDKTLVKYTVG